MYRLDAATDLRVSGAGLVCWDRLAGTEGMAGGTCGNVLANLAYLGAKATLFDRLDDLDPWGKLILEDLESLGVRTKFAKLFPSDNAPVLQRWLAKGKRNPKGWRWERKQVPLEALQIAGLEGKYQAARVFFFDRANAATLTLARHYAEWGEMVYFEPQGREELSEEALGLAQVVKYADTYFPKDGWIAPQAQIEVRTLGDGGLRWRLGQEEGWLPAYTARAVDTAGSGDWLSAGLIAGLHADGYMGAEEPAKLVRALRFGMALAAANCEHLGARGVVYDLSRGELAERLGHLRARRKVA